MTDVANKLYLEALDKARQTPPDFAEALPLLLKARAEGSADATYALGTWYLHGLQPLIEVDLDHGVALLREAADRGNLEAMYELGVCYDKGVGVCIDYSEAFDLYVTAGLRGHAEACYAVGRGYKEGIGIAADERVARLWDERTIELGIDPETGGVTDQ